MPSGDVKPLVLASTVVAVALACAGLLLAPTAGAEQLGTTIPSNNLPMRSRLLTAMSLVLVELERALRLGGLIRGTGHLKNLRPGNPPPAPARRTGCEPRSAWRATGWQW